MKQKIKLWQLMGFAVTSLGGTLLHFLYEWLGNAIWIAPFSGINESTWEHMKLLFFPMFLFSLFEYRFFKEEYENFRAVKLIGILIGLILIPVFYYTYTGISGVTVDFINIAIFYIAGAIAYFIETKLMKKGVGRKFPQKIVFPILTGIAILFVVFTFFTPEIPLFKDPVTKTYGIEKAPL